jgi:Predicted metal-dependent hydrolase of the TIM-barrel fold
MCAVRIDVHHHLLSPQYVKELANVGVVESGGVPFPQWRPEDSLTMMDRQGIDTALLSVSSPGLCFGNGVRVREIARSLNEFAAQCQTRWPERFGFFATLPLPDVESTLAEIAYALDVLHADGIGLLSNYAGVYLGDPAFDAIFAALDRRAAVVFIHPTVFTGREIPAAKNAGSPIPTLPGFMLEFVFDTTRAVANLVLSGTLKKYPRIRIILSHAGGTVPFVANKIVSGAIMTRCPQVLTGQTTLPQADMLAEKMRAIRDDVFDQLQGLYYDTALSANAHALSSLQQLVPASHMLLGTDYPFAPEREAHTTLNGIASAVGLSEQDRQAIEGNNAFQLFPRRHASE